MIFALSGNPNCGKTTLYNLLTGSDRHVGNFAGVTVDVKSGATKKYGFSVADLPGIYSLRPYSAEEKLARDFLLSSRLDGIIDVVDATNPERNFYLTLQLLELGLPVVVALNMIDEAEKGGVVIDCGRLSSLLGASVVPISALRNRGIDELASAAKRSVSSPCGGSVYPDDSFVTAVSNVVSSSAEERGLSPTFVATSIIGGDKFDFLSEQTVKKIEEILENEENSTNTDRYALLADARYSIIEKIVGETFVKSKKQPEKRRDEKIDRILTNKYAAIPLFVLVMFVVFVLSFDVIGKYLSEALETGINELESVCVRVMETNGANKILVSLVQNGVFAGVGGVLCFIPYILTLFFFLSLVEDTGYMARIAFVTDKLLTKIGLSGRSVVPMLIGFGCTVPAAMSTRTIPSSRDKKMTLLLLPFMSCSAKLPVYALFCAAYLSRYKGLVTFSLYLIGVLTGVIVAISLNKTKFKGKPVPFVMELPNYRLPSPKSVFRLMWEKAKDYVKKTFGAIFIASIAVWGMRSFTPSLQFTECTDESILCRISTFFAPLFRPLGLGDWRIVSSLVVGFTAKEAVVGTLGILFPSGIGGVFSAASAYSFLIFVLLYTPCAAAITAIGKELNSPIKAFFMVVFQCAVAYVAAFCCYTIFTFLGG